MRQVKGLDKGKCRFCGASVYWTRTAKNNKPIQVELKVRTIVDKYGEVINGHEPHFANCPNYPKGDKK